MKTTVLIFGLIVAVIVLIAASLRGAYFRMLQHRATLAPKWWPFSKKTIQWIAITANSATILTVLCSIAYCIYLIYWRYAVYIVVCAIILWPIWIGGSILGGTIASKCVNRKAKEDGQEPPPPECL